MMVNHEATTGERKVGGIDNLHVGTKIQLQAQRDVASIVHFTTLIGHVSGEFLLVKSPIVRNVPFIFYDAEEVGVHAFAGTTIFTFNSVVTRTLLSPTYYMHLLYPTDVKTLCLRGALRVRVKISGNIEFVDAAKHTCSAAMCLINLSQSGAALETLASVPIGSDVTLRFSVHDVGQDAQFLVHAIVRSQKVCTRSNGNSENCFLYGLEFANLLVQDLNALKILTYEIALKDRRNIV